MYLRKFHSVKTLFGEWWHASKPKVNCLGTDNLPNYNVDMAA